MNQFKITNHECKLHPNNLIQKICLVPGCSTPLCCNVCIQGGIHNASHIEYLINIESFIDQISTHYKIIRNHITYDILMDHLEHEFLQKPDIFILKLENHINEEKKNVKNTLNVIMNNFMKLCDDMQKEIYHNLDLQLITLKQNYSYLSNKINSIFNKTINDYKGGSSDNINNEGIEKNNTEGVNIIDNNEKEIGNNSITKNLIELINNTKNNEEYDILIKNLKNDIDEMKSFQSKVDISYDIQQDMQLMIQELHEQTLLTPKTQACLHPNYEEVIYNIMLYFREYMKDQFNIDEVILPLSLPKKGTLIEFDDLFNEQPPPEEGYESDEEEAAMKL